MNRSLTFLISLLLIGCGGTETAVPVVDQEFLAVLDADGTQRVIPSSEFHHGGTASQGQKVLAIDRKSGRKVWATPEQLYGQPPGVARYIPVTHADPAALQSEKVRP